MAASLKVGGYLCKFIDELPDDLLCKSCRHVARQPHLTTCCGEQFCHTCVVDVECPEKCGQQVQKHQLVTHIANECPKRDFTCMHCGFKATYEVVSEQHWPECQNYPVPCPNRCQIGAVERNTLEDHLKMCSLQVVDCDFSYAGCDEKLQRQHMEKHIEENTQKHLALMAAASMKMSREFEQKLQEQRDEFQGYLEQKERETAEQLKLKDEQVKAVEKRLQQSVREREEKIERMRKSLQKEQKEGEQQLQQQLEQKERQINHIQESLQQLQEKDNEVQGELHEKQQQIDVLKEQIVQVKQDHEERIKAVEQRREEQIKSLEVQSQQQVERIENQLKEKEQELGQLSMKLGVAPFHFTMSNFNQLKTNDAYWYSSPTYTHTFGYKFSIMVRPNGSFSEGWHTHVSVMLNAISGEFDATLQWPAKFTITLQLLNQHRDQDHITVTEQFQWSKPKIGTQRTVDYFSRTVIAHTDLELNAQKQTQYLKDDCLRFCITKIEARND